MKINSKKKRSITIPQQLRKVCPVCDHYFIHTVPYGHEAEEKIKEFNLYQILESKLTGTKRARSIKQLGLYWKRNEVVAELLSDHDNVLDRRDIDFDVKIKVAKKHPWMIKRFRVVNGIAHIELISISFENMKHLEANKFFDKGFPEQAKMVNMICDDLTRLAKEKMG